MPDNNQYETILQLACTFAWFYNFHTGLSNTVPPYGHQITGPVTLFMGKFQFLQSNALLDKNLLNLAPKQHYDCHMPVIKLF